MYVLGCAQREVKWECYAYSKDELNMERATADADKGVCELERADGFQYKFNTGSRLGGCDGCACCRRIIKRGIAEARSVADHPSAENYQFRGVPNSRGQLVAFVTRGDLNGAAAGTHCYFRIAVISHRLKAMPFSIRGFDLRREVALPMNEPLEVLMKGGETRTFQLPTPPVGSGTRDVVLSLEVCAGKVVLNSGSAGNAGVAVRPGEFSGVHGGVEPTRVQLRDNQKLEVQGFGGNAVSFLLQADVPTAHRWLEPKPNRTIWIENAEASSGGAVTLAWSPALLFGAGQPTAGRKDAVEYEVFWMRDYLVRSSADQPRGNASSACGLYKEYRDRIATRIHTKNQRRVEVRELEPDVMYLFNVVARSVRTGESTAYEAARVFVKRRAIVGGGVPKISLFTDRLLPMFMLCVLLGLIFWKFVLPMMRTSRRSWDLEMSSRGGSARSWGGGGGGGGEGASSYFPPSVVGMSDTPGGAYGQLR